MSTINKHSVDVYVLVLPQLRQLEVDEDLAGFDHLIMLRIRYGNILEFEPVEPKHPEALHSCIKPCDLREIFQEFANEVILNRRDLKDQKGRYYQE